MFLLQILTPSHCEFQGEAERLTLRAETGELTVLSGHAPYCAAVCRGQGRIVKEGRELPFTNGAGVLTVQKDKTVLMIKDFRKFPDEASATDSDFSETKRKP